MIFIHPDARIFGNVLYVYPGICNAGKVSEILYIRPKPNTSEIYRDGTVVCIWENLPDYIKITFKNNGKKYFKEIKV